MTNRMFRAALLASTCLVPGSLLADGTLPTDPTIISGDIAISTPTTTDMLVEQSSQFGVINWGSFSIGAGNAVSFQNGSGATLNRVTGGNLSTIMGRLDATGSVYLINRNGIVVGRDGVVSTGGTFVASTLDIRNGDFLDGGDATFRGDGQGMVINLGRISSLGGDVAILAQDVVNEGKISARNGTAGLVAGREILMRDGAVADGLFAVRIGGSDSSVTDSGTIAAAAAELRANGGNVYALAGNTGGTIAATGVKKEGGRVFLTAGEGGSVTVEKDVSAQNGDGSGGRIVVDGGTVDVSGRLDASGNAGGEVRITSAIETTFSGEILAFGDEFTEDGGFVEVSGPHLAFSGTVDSGGGTLLIDPNNIEISDYNSELLVGASGASLFSTATLTGLLATSDVILSTEGTDGEAGTIAITSDLIYSSSNDLTLLAHGDIFAMASIQNTQETGGGALNLVAGWDGSTGLGGFDPAAFSGALSGVTAFGNGTGDIYNYGATPHVAIGAVILGDGAQTYGIALGSMSGSTRVYGQNVQLRGSDNVEAYYGSAQIGMNSLWVADGANVTGDILVRATNDIELTGGTSTFGAAQIGHVGFDAGQDVKTITTAANIVVEGLGDLTLASGENALGVPYTMVGNGTRSGSGADFPVGTRAGDITVTMGGEVSLDDSSTGVDAWLGNGTSDYLGISGDLTVTAAAFDTSATATVAPGGLGDVDVHALAEVLIGGNVTVKTTDSGLRLSGDTAMIDCECNSVTSDFDLVVQASDNLRLEKTFAFDNSGTGRVALAAGTNFRNDAGAAAFGAMTNSRWLVYSTRPDKNTGDIGVLDADFLRYNQTFDAANPFAVASSGSGLVYAVRPVISVGNATTTYGVGPTLPTPILLVGGSAVNAAAFGMTLSATQVDTGIVTLSGSGNYNAGNWTNALYATATPTGTVARIDGLGLNEGDLTVNRATLGAEIVGAPIKTYDGTTAATLSASDFALTGFVSGEGASVTQTGGTYAQANAGVEVQVDAVLGAGDFLANAGTDLSNYILPTSASGTGAIDRALLSVSIVGTPTKTYDGTTTATLTAGNFLLSGFVTGEGASVTKGSGDYASADAGSSIGVSTALLAGDFAANAGTLLSNYVLPTTASGLGSIDRAVLTASITGTPTKTYDGTRTATLTAADFLLTGFVAGQGATITQTAGLYDTANAGTAVGVTATLAAGDFSGLRATNLNNYVLPTSASGTGVIDRANLSVAIVGTPTKTYDGTTQATLTSGDFVLDGFVAGEGATVTQTIGTYSTANASTGNKVNADLAASDFDADAGTLLSNYVLPTLASGTGTIDRAVVTAQIVGTPTKTFDGTTVATLTADNFLLSGFVSGEGATVLQTRGTYAQSSGSGLIQVSADLGDGALAADSGTNLNNYVLPTRALGLGRIVSPVQPQPFIPQTTPMQTFETTPLGEPSGPAGGLEVIDPETTQRVLDEIRAGAAFCKALVREEYVIDCLSDRLQSVADGLSAVGEYSEVRGALQEAADRLHAVVLANASQELAQQVMRANGQRSSRPLTAVSTAALGSANAQAAQILEETGLVLLRSSTESFARQEAFTQVAQVVNSTKVLLRSS